MNLLRPLQWLRDKVVDIYTVVTNYIHSSSEKLARIGNELVADAKGDFTNLSTELNNIWQFSPAQRRTAALYISAIFGKIGYTPIITCITLIFAVLKLIAGSVCKTLGGEFFGFIKDLFVILGDFANEGLKIAARYLNEFVNVIGDALNYLGRKFARMCARIGAAIARALESFFRNLNRVCQFIVSCIDTICTKIANLFIEIFRVLKHIVMSIIDLASSVISGVFDLFERGIDYLVNKSLQFVANSVLGVLILGFGVLKTLSIAAKGAGLSLAALILETPVVHYISGLAKSLFILDESAFAAGGSMLDAIYRSIRSFFGYNNLAVNSHRIIREDTDYFSRNARDNMHALNDIVADTGAKIVTAYNKEKATLLGKSSWGQQDDIEDTQQSLSATSQKKSRRRQIC